MTSIFSQASFFQGGNKNQTCCQGQQARYQFGQALGNQGSDFNVLDQQLANNTKEYQNLQIQREQAKSSRTRKSSDDQMSLFVDNLIFEENADNIEEDNYHNQTHAQIESNILNMIDDEPLENESNLEKSEAKSDYNWNDIIRKQDDKFNSPRTPYSPLALTTQASADTHSQSIFSAQSNEDIFASPASSIQASQQDIKVNDFIQLLDEQSPSPQQQKVSEQSNTDDKQESIERKDKEQSQFDFPEGGWQCSSCSNYNFKGRKQCYRCKKSRDSNDIRGKPGHMFLSNGEKAALKVAKQNAKKQRSKKKNCNSHDCANEKQGQVRPGDWSCYRCQNFNYSFRDVCNKCGLLKQESDYYTSNFAPNSIDWSTVNMQSYTAPISQTMGYNQQYQQQMYQQSVQQQQHIQQQQQMCMMANYNTFVPQHLYQQQQQYQQFGVPQQ